MKRLLLLVVFLSSWIASYSQSVVIHEPVILEKSHRTVRIDSVVLTSDGSVFYLRILNERESGGWFCLSREVHLYSENEFIASAKKIEGIPLCPQAHRFESIGEEVAFQLYFPAIDNQLSWLSLEEVCDQACLKLSGIVLDVRFNEKAGVFDKALDCYREGDYLRCIKGFEKVLTPPLPLQERTSLYAFAYYYIIAGYLRSDRREEGLVWYYQLQSSNLEDKLTVVRRLQEEFSLPE
jgi:hypothetical protein